MERGGRVLESVVMYTAMGKRTHPGHAADGRRLDEGLACAARYPPLHPNRQLAAHAVGAVCHGMQVYPLKVFEAVQHAEHDRGHVVPDIAAQIGLHPARL